MANELSYKKATVTIKDSVEYLGNLVLQNGNPDKYMFNDGYYSYTTNTLPTGEGWGEAHFYIKDYLGSNRMVMSKTGQTEQVNHYYPYGGIIGGIDLHPTFQTYKYEGKELDNTFGLDWYDIHARQYDPVIPSWHAIDPMCEKYYNLSPYAFCGNNPINNIDAFGKDILPVIYQKTDYSGNPIAINYRSNINYMEAMRMFGQTSYGKQFIGSFLEKGYSQYGVSGNGSRSQYVFMIQEMDLSPSEGTFMPNSNGSLHFEECGGKLYIIMKIDVRYKSVNELVETITHELALHGSDIDMWINAYESGGIGLAEEIFNEDSNGNKDHKDLEESNYQNIGVANYNDTMSELIQMYPQLQYIFIERNSTDD